MKRVLAALLAVYFGGCATEAEPVGYGEGLGTPENPVPRDDVSYAVTSQVSTPNAPIPAPVAASVAKMRAFASAPADTLLALVQSTSFPELTQLNAQLPATLATRLRGWMDVEIDKVKIRTFTLRQYATDVSTFAETALRSYTIDSELSFSPTQTQHSLRAMRFRLAGFDVVIPIGGLKADVIAQKPVVTVDVAGAITFGDHTFGLAFGSHAWHAINLASTQQFGADVTSTLENAIDCGAFGTAVAAKCYGTSCVGHQAQLTSICEKGLELLATQLSTGVNAVTVDELHVVSGTAQLIDENIDGLADRIEGAWNVELGNSSTVKFTAEAVR